MKKILLILFCFFAFTAFNSDAGIVEQLQAVIAKRNTITLPPWYADANVELSWKPTSTSDFTAYRNDGTPVAGTEIGTVVIVNDSGTLAMEIDETRTASGGGSDPGGDRIYWANTAEAIFDPDAAHTICLKINPSTTISTTTIIWMSADYTDIPSPAEFIKVQTQSSGFLQGVYDYGATGQSAGENSYSTASYYTIAYSWDATSGIPNVNHTFDLNGGASYIANQAEIQDVFDSTASAIFLGTFGDVTVQAGATLRISQMAVVAGFRFNCNTLTGW